MIQLVKETRNPKTRKKKMTNATTNTATATTTVRIFWADANDSTSEIAFHADTIQMANMTHQELLDEVYFLQGNNPEGTKLFDSQCTLSVGDLIEVNGERTSDDVAPECTVYIVAPVGFIKIQVNEWDTQFTKWQNKNAVDRIWMARQLYKVIQHAS